MRNPGVFFGIAIDFTQAGLYCIFMTKKRRTKGGFAYRVLNRANGKLRIFKKDLDLVAFENIPAEGIYML
ncbi:MAG: hypothetical protein E4H40_05890 [Candidatus Brocadiia bacterium]|nr:MAG: hypothetical protein E4H40_05890 [Candidatus Brocadiia bacterium]